MRRLTTFSLLAPLAFLGGCSQLSVPSFRLPEVRPHERTAVATPALAVAAESSLLAANTQRSQEATEGASGGWLERPASPRRTRVELLQQREDGLTRTVDGTYLLAQRGFSGRYGATFSAAREQVTETSPDVQEQAGGDYREDRNRHGLELMAREGRGQYSLAYSRDSSDDDTSGTLRVALSQQLFRDQTRVVLAWDRTRQELERRGDATFRRDNERRGYLFAVEHLLAPRVELAATLEGRSATGYLADPYRSVRYLAPATPLGMAWQPEQVPDQRSSDALTLRGRYSLQRGNQVGMDYRYYQDNWGMAAHTVKADYRHPVGDHLLLQAQLRHHRQTAAYFHRDLLATRAAATSLLSRNPALSTLQATGVSLGFQWDFLRSRWMGAEGATLFGRLEHRRQRHDDYLEIRSGLLPGTEPRWRGHTTQLQLGISASF